MSTLDPDLELQQPGAASEPAGSPRPAAARKLAVLLGALTGALTLVAMARLVAGAFPGGMSGFAWVVVLAALLPWVVYVAVCARHGRLSGRRMAGVVALVLVGAVAVWLPVPSPVLALVCSFAAFVLVWVGDWPDRRGQGPERFVRIEELQHEDDLD